AAPWRGKLLDEERPHVRGGRQCWDRGASPYAVGCRLAGGLQLAALPQVHVAESDLRLGIWRMARLMPPPNMRLQLPAPVLKHSRSSYRTSLWIGRHPMRMT